jgi:phenylacetate-CoA ligase
LIESNYEYILQQIDAYKPKVIRCYPDPLLFLAKYRQQHPEFLFSPDAIFTTGNTLFPKTRNEIESAFGCKIFDSYSCEGNACVFECPTHTCYHSTEEYGISEIVNEHGIPIKNGVGRLISTDLWNFAHPFVRYDTQDLVEVDDTPCECGRKHLKYLRILGRNNEVLVMPSGRKFIVHNFTGFFQTDIPEMKKSIDQFQVVKKQDNSVIFKIVVNNNYDNDTENYLIYFWEQELGVKVTVEVVKEIPVMQNNKHRFIINE